ncbi:MAG TPA: hypothetical protein VL996_14945 [Methylocella sp.]|nr:hypothetical protein [Methylocella sp.]
MGFSVLQSTEHEGHGTATASFDLEIIAKREADKKDEDDRKKVLKDYPELKTLRGNGQA